MTTGSLTPASTGHLTNTWLTVSARNSTPSAEHRNFSLVAQYYALGKLRSLVWLPEIRSAIQNPKDTFRYIMADIKVFTKLFWLFLISHARKLSLVHMGLYIFSIHSEISCFQGSLWANSLQWNTCCFSMDVHLASEWMLPGWSRCALFWPLQPECALYSVPLQSEPLSKVCFVSPWFLWSVFLLLDVDLN